VLYSWFSFLFTANPGSQAVWKQKNHPSPCAFRKESRNAAPTLRECERKKAQQKDKLGRKVHPTPSSVCFEIPIKVATVSSDCRATAWENVAVLIILRLNSVLCAICRAESFGETHLVWERVTLEFTFLFARKHTLLKLGWPRTRLPLLSVTKSISDTLQGPSKDHSVNEVIKNRKQRNCSCAFARACGNSSRLSTPFWAAVRFFYASQQSIFLQTLPKNHQTTKKKQHKDQLRSGWFCQ
jgi:hypothetical protein